MKQSKHNIYYSPKEVRTILERSIDTALDGLKGYCNDPVSDFTRCRKLPARTLIECIMSVKPQTLPIIKSNKTAK